LLASAASVKGGRTGFDMEALGRPLPVAVAVMVVLNWGNECEGVEKPEGTWRECSEGLAEVPVMMDTL